MSKDDKFINIDRFSKLVLEKYGIIKFDLVDEKDNEAKDGYEFTINGHINGPNNSEIFSYYTGRIEALFNPLVNQLFYRVIEGTIKPTGISCIPIPTD